MDFVFGRQENRRRKQSIAQTRTILTVESLEQRDLLTTFNPLSLLGEAAGRMEPLSSAGPTGYTPAQVSQAYGFNQISFNNGTIKGNGSGQTIAIVVAYDDPNIASDLHHFDLTFGLPDPVFTKVNQNGGTAPPVASTAWSNETALDVEWAHAMAPAANILLVEANSVNNSDLFAAVKYAARQPGVSVVSMSWGGTEYSGETSDDSVFTTPAGHQGVSFVASTGDAGAPAIYPAASPNVLSVGGTSLYLSAAGYGSETAWHNGGGGISTVEAKPAYQNGVVAQSATKRTTPDVAYDADPNTGFAVYNSFGNPASAAWVQMGGTSAGAPQWAALIAIANQGRALQGMSSLNGRSQLLPELYQMPSWDFHDITSGNSDGSPAYTAVGGYDLVTGRGSPFADRVVAALSGQVLSNNPPPASPPSAPSAPGAPGITPGSTAASPPASPPNPFDQIAADALFVLRGWLSRDLNLFLQGWQDAQAVLMANPGSAPALQQAFFLDLLSDVKAINS